MPRNGVAWYSPSTPTASPGRIFVLKSLPVKLERFKPKVGFRARDPVACWALAVSVVIITTAANNNFFIFILFFKFYNKY